jgi:hypothetical protein
MSSGLTNEKGQGASHATQSSVPGTVQDKVRNSTTKIPINLSTNNHQAPKSVEDKLPDAVHDTGSNPKTGKVSHATGDSKVPKALQEGLPEKVEKIVPNAIHDTKGATFSDGSVSK